MVQIISKLIKVVHYWIISKFLDFQKLQKDIVYGVLWTFPEFQTKKSVTNGEIQQTLYHVRVKPWFYPEQKAAFHWLSAALYCSVVLFCIGY